MDQITAWQVGMAIFKALASFWFLGASLTFSEVRKQEMKNFGADYRMDYQDIIFKWPVFWYEALTK